MRQVGVLAAPGLISLEKMTKRLSEDHDRAKLLERGLRVIGGITMNAEAARTNMVYFDLDESIPFTSEQLEVRMKEQGVLIDSAGPRRVRLVTHYWIDDQDVQYVIEAFKKVLNQIPAGPGSGAGSI